jgi:hypothetical protein
MVRHNESRERIEAMAANGPSTGAAQGAPPFEAGRIGWVSLLVRECVRDGAKHVHALEETQGVVLVFQNSVLNRFTPKSSAEEY